MAIFIICILLIVIAILLPMLIGCIVALDNIKREMQKIKEAAYEMKYL